MSDASRMSLRVWITTGPLRSPAGPTDDGPPIRDAACWGNMTESFPPNPKEAMACAGLGRSSTGGDNGAAAEAAVVR